MCIRDRGAGGKFSTLRSHPSDVTGRRKHELSMSEHNQNATLAVFLDLENIAIGAREAHYARFSIQKVLERLLLKGHIVVKKAYCDFDRYKEFKRDLHEAAFELIEIPHVRQSGKNSADIRMVVDALDLCLSLIHISEPTRLLSISYAVF